MRLHAVILFGRRAVVPVPAKAGARVAFTCDFLRGACRAITNDATFPHEHTARGGAGQNARRHRPSDEQSCDQRQPKSDGGADRNGPRDARSTDPLGAVRVSAMRQAKRQTEHVKLSRIHSAIFDIWKSRKVSMRMM